MRHLFQTVTDFSRSEDALRCRRYGVIEARDGRFHRVCLRPFPKLTSGPEILLLGEPYHRYMPGDRCLLYYNQLHRFPNYLAAKYVVTARDTQLSTICRTLEALDEIARLKRSDAILCDAGNWRLSTAIMFRCGWQPHCPSRWHRYFIRRFYGNYPPPAAWIAGGEVSPSPASVLPDAACMASPSPSVA